MSEGPETIERIFEALKATIDAGADLQEHEWPEFGGLVFVHGCYRAMEDAHKLEQTETQRRRLLVLIRNIGALVEGWSPVTTADLAEAEFLFGKLRQQ